MNKIIQWIKNRKDIRLRMFIAKNLRMDILDDPSWYEKQVRNSKSRAERKTKLWVLKNLNIHSTERDFQKWSDYILTGKPINES